MLRYGMELLLLLMTTRHCQGRPKAPPGDAKCVTEILGDKNKEVRGAKFKTVATRYHILRLKFTKFDFGWDSAPDPAGGAHSAPPLPRLCNWI